MISSVEYSHALRRQARWATLLLLASTSCRAPLADSSLTKGLADVFSWNKSLDRKPWSEPRAGTTRGLLSLSLFSDFSADVVSTLAGSPEVPMEVGMLGKFGLILGRESYLTEEVSLVYGLDYRFLKPEKPVGVGGVDFSDYFAFGDVHYMEAFLGLRLSWDPLGNDRMRPYLLSKFAYVPSVKSPSTILFGEQPGSFIQNAEFTFEGSPYWNYGVGAGIQYEISPRVTLHVGGIYEWPMDPSEDVVDVTATSNDGSFDIIVPTAISMEPEGWIFLGGLTWTY